MKRIRIAVFGLLASLTLSGFVHAQADFVTAYNSTFTVRNVSQNNVDATNRAVKPGDILMYQVQLEGTAPVNNEVIRTRTGALEGTMTLVDSTDGRLEGSYIYFPNVTDDKNNWKRTFAYYMRVEREPVKPVVTMSFGAQDVTVNIEGAFAQPTASLNTNTPEAVPQTGANYNLLLVLGAFVSLMILGRIRRKL